MGESVNHEPAEELSALRAANAELRGELERMRDEQLRLLDERARLRAKIDEARQQLAAEDQAHREARERLAAEVDRAYRDGRERFAAELGNGGLWAAEQLNRLHQRLSSLMSLGQRTASSLARRR